MVTEEVMISLMISVIGVHANLPPTPQFSRYQQALQILLYYDDLEVTNPLVSHTKMHKIGKIMEQVHAIHV